MVKDNESFCNEIMNSLISMNQEASVYIFYNFYNFLLGMHIFIIQPLQKL